MRDDPAAGHGASDETENRGINRIPVRLAVTRKGRSALLGRTRDISLHGAFIETRETFSVGTLLPMVVSLGDKQDIAVHAEVVRVTDDGMGLRFLKVDKDGARRLRRWVVDHTSVAGSRRQVAQLFEAARRIRPITDPARVREVLSDIRAQRAEVTLVPVDRMARDHAVIASVTDGGLVFSAREHTSLAPGEDVQALVTTAFVSFAFGLRIVSARGAEVVCALPEMITFSERRVRERRQAPAGSRVVLSAPVEGEPALSFPVIDVSDDGFSFSVPPEVLMTPGTRLDGALLEVGGHVRTLGRAEVRNIRPEEEARGRRVGVLLGRPPSMVTPVTAPPKRTRSLLSVFSRVRDAVSVVVNRGRERLGVATADDQARRVVVRQDGLPIRGLLDTTSVGDGKLRCPLVIVIPGFAGRKEQLSFLAGILTDGFRRHHADIAVLRVDGTNNLGESGKDPGCERDGLHCMHYTTSGIIDDTLAALRWSRRNPFVDPTHIVLVSMSMASIGVRHVMTLPEAADVGLWFSYMGAADAVDTVRNVSGNVDFHAYAVRGERVGYISLNGVLTDGDHFWRDCIEGGLGYLDAAIEEMSRIRSDVVWLRGKWDAFMDPRRVDALMQAPAQGTREIIDVESGHLPRTSEEAVTQFVDVTRRIFRYVHGASVARFSPSLGRLVLKHDAEWRAVRRATLGDRVSWWRDYLLEEDGPGFDIVEYAPDYRAFMDLQADRVGSGDGVRRRVLELGAGTGNLSRRLVARGFEVVATDLVPEALSVLHRKVGAASGLTTSVVDLEGSPWIAYRRFIAGDLGGPLSLAERIPGVQRALLSELVAHDGDELRAVLKGWAVDPQALAKTWRLDARAADLLCDLHMLAQSVSGRLDRSLAAERCKVIPPSVFSEQRGLPFDDASFDAVALSLVLSYVSHPEDSLFEIRRVLRPKGVLVLSSMIRDSDSSRLYLDLIDVLERAPSDLLGDVPDLESRRQGLLSACRRFIDHAAELYRVEEEGLFRFYGEVELRHAVACRGFEDIKVERAFGSPPQAIVLTCVRPKES